MKSLQFLFFSFLIWGLFCPYAFAIKLKWIPVKDLNQSVHYPGGWFSNLQLTTYVGRADLKNGQALGNYSPYHNELSAGDANGKEVKIPEKAVELLAYPPGTLSWAVVGRGYEVVPGFNIITDKRDIPNYLVLGGVSANNREKMFICRGFHSQGHLLVGYYRFSKPNKCYAANGGVERAYKQFEMLVVNAYGILNGIEG